MINLFKKGFIYLTLMLLVLGSFSVESAHAETAEWNPGEQYFKGDYDYKAAQPASLNWNRQSSFNSIDLNPRIKWIHTLPGSSTRYFGGTPVIGKDGSIYIKQLDSLYAFNPDGSVKWVTNSPNGDVSIGYDGTLFIGGTALNPNDGSVKWSYKGYSRATPAIGDGVIYTTVDNKLVALNYEDGSVIWKKPEFAAYSSYSPSPVVSSDGTIYVSTDASASSYSYLYAFDKDGNEKWKYQYKQSKGGTGNVPTIGPDGTIYTIKDTTLHAISPNGELLWELKFSKKINQVVISKDEVIYVGSWDYNFYALNKDGSEKWRKSIGTYVRSVPIIDNNGNIIVTDNSGNLLSMNTSGEIKWTLKLDHSSSESSPSIDKDGTIYIGASYSLVAVTGEKNANQSCSIYDIIDKLLENPQTKEDIERAKSYINNIKNKVNDWESKINEYENK